ncbi:Coiled-coil domain-containing protein 94, partial [Homalodisca vitripennis]
LLENRTQQSKQELELLESLEDLKDLNRRQRSIDYDSMLSQYDTKEAREKILKMQEEQDEKFIRSVFGGNKRVIKEEIVEEVDEDKCVPPPEKKSLIVNKSSSSSSSSTTSKPTSTSTSKSQSTQDTSWNRSVGVMAKKPLTGLVRVKKQEPVVASTQVSADSTNSQGQKPALSLVGAYSDSDDSESN